jgi:hypothetical protein
MVELAPDWACKDVSTFSKVVLLPGCQGGFNDGQPHPLVGFTKDLMMVDLTPGPNLRERVGDGH